VGLRLSVDTLGVLIALIGAGILLMLARLLLILGKLKGFADNLPVVKRIGRVRVLVSDRSTVPFSFWFWPVAYVVLPAELLAHPEDWRIALRHEIQHHRQGDTLGSGGGGD
jgi:membrane-bound lytic murein transglycosylase D